MVLIPTLTNWWPGGGSDQSPELRPGLSEEDISPGILGFLFTALVAVLLIVIVRDMAKRMRRMKYSDQVDSEQAGDEPEFPGEIVPAEISEAQQRARSFAAEARFGHTQDPSQTGDEPPADEGASPNRAG